MRNNITLLLADDDDINNFIINRLATKTPYNVVVKEFANGRDTLSFLIESMKASTLPNVAFVDIDMPGINGWELLDELTKMPEVPLRFMHTYMVSSSVNDLDMQRAEGYQYVKGFISKPLDVDMLTKILDQYLASLS